MKCSFGISNFLEETSSLSHSFPLFLCTVHLRRLSYLSLLFFGTLHLDGYIFPFLLWLSLLFFSQLFVSPPQTNILPYCIYFSWGWLWSLSPVQCYKPPSTVLQALYLLDLIPLIYLLFLLIRDLIRSYLNGLVVFPTFFNLSLNLAIRSSWSEPQSASSLVFADCMDFSIFGWKEYNQYDFSVDHLVTSMCRVISCVLGIGCLLWPVPTLGKTMLAFAVLCFVLQDQICLLLQVSLDFLLLDSSPL